MIPSVSVIRQFAKNNRSLLSLGFAALLAELAYAILNLSALPVYAKYTLHSEQIFGAMLSTFLLTEAIGRPMFGALGDKIGRKPLMMAGPIITAVTSYLTIVLHGPYTIAGLFILRAIDGFGSGALWPTAFATVGDVVEEENRTTAMSMLNVTYMSGLALGFLLGGVVNEFFGTYTASFYLVSVLLVLAAIVMFFFLPANLGKGEHKVPAHSDILEVPTLEPATEFKLSTLTRSFRAVPDLIVQACVIFLGMGMLMGIVKLYALDHLGLSEVQFGLAVAPIAAAMGIFAVPLGRLGDKYGKCLAVSWGLFGAAIAMWVLAIFRSIILAGAAGVIIGLAFTIAFPAWMALVASITESNRRGEVLGAVGMAQGLAAIVGASLGTFIYGSDMLSFPRLGIVNYNVPFWLSAILLSAGAVMSFTWVCGRHSHKDPCGGVKDWQRRFVVIASIVGLASLLIWIGYRYARPVAPDRVAWAWVQQLVRGKPEKAQKFALASFGDEWNGKLATEKAAKKFHSWKVKREARYTVMGPESETKKFAHVPVKFTFTGNKMKTEYVRLCKMADGEWKVCGLYSVK